MARVPLRRGGRRTGFLVAAAALIGLVVGCRTTSVATQNLDAVLGSNDRLRYRGDTTTIAKELFAGAIGRLTAGFAKPSDEAQVDTIKDPTQLGLESMLMLSRSRQGPRVWRENEQVRVLTRYARFAPSQLLRERALLELAPHGLRLEVPESFKPVAEAANAADLMVTLDGLVDATRGLLADRGSETAKLDFDSAIELLGAGEYDVQSGSRLLRAIAPFLRGVGLPTEQRDLLSELSRRVQGMMVREALQYGLLDPSSVARAAAFKSAIEVFGEPFTIEAAVALVPAAFHPDWVRERFRAFNVPSIPADSTEVHIVVAEALEEMGLPAAATLDTIEALQLERLTYEALHFVAINDLLFPDRSRHAAMRALRSVSGEALSTYRDEEWDDWFKDRADQLGTEIVRRRREAEAEPGSGSS